MVLALNQTADQFVDLRGVNDYDDTNARTQTFRLTEHVEFDPHLSLVVHALTETGETHCELGTT